MKKNVASQKIGAQMVTAADGTAFTSAVTVYVTGDAGTQAIGSVGSGACTHEGNGYHTYAPAQAETNYDLIAFTFIGTGAVPATVQVFPSFPQTGDSNALLTGTGAVSFASIAVAGTTQFTGKVSAFNGWSIAGGTNSDALTLTGASGGGGFVATGNGAGHGILATGGNTSGVGIYGLGGTNGTGMFAVGTGTGVGFGMNGGTTGAGIAVVGGPTSGNGIVVTTTSGDAVSLTATGTSKHGLVVTGGNGGTSDGIKAVAGTGGVPIRGDITGNITGTLSGTVSADVVSISGSTAAANNLEESTEAIAYGTIDGTGATTTVFLSSALTPDATVADQFKGRVLIFKSDTSTAALQGQATTISSHTRTSAEVITLTVVALTTAPATGDTFVIL